MRPIVCFILLCLVASMDGRYRCDYTHFAETEGWMKLHRIPANWKEARLRCHLEGGNLVSPLNRSFKQAILSMITHSICPQCAVYTGIHATYSRGDFSSVEGVPLLEIPHTWAVNEPDNFNDSESCIAMLSDGTLADVNCNDPYPYICYKKATAHVHLNICGTLDSEYDLYSRTGSCYKFHKVPRTWSRAYMTCAAEGGHLVIINSETEANIMKELFDKNPPNQMIGNFWKYVAYIGVYDWGEHGDWLTVDGRNIKDAGFWKFASGEPNNGSTIHTPEYCIVMHKDGALHDVACDNNYAFICEKRPDSPLCASED